MADLLPAVGDREEHCVHGAVFLANKSDKNCGCCTKFEHPTITNTNSDNLCQLGGGGGSGDELVPHVDTNATTSLEVPNNDSSGLQLVPHVTIDVPSSIEVPNNNSGLLLVPHVTIDVPSSIELVPQVTLDVPSSIEVPSYNSGPQLVPHVASKVTIVLEVANNNSAGQQDGNSDGDLKHGALFAVGDCATSIAAIVSNPPSSGKPAYLVAVGIVFTAGVLAVLAAIWVSRDARKRRAAKKKILYASAATFILGLAINVYAYKVKK